MYWAFKIPIKQTKIKVWICPECYKKLELGDEIRIVKKKHTYMCIHLNPK